MRTKKNREQVPKDVAARVLFYSDRTCCVCRVRGKPVQIHHIDEDPSKSDIRDLAVLCFECHRETQIRGGFDRKLDAEQVILYRDDWNRLIARNRAAEEVEGGRESHGSIDVEYSTTIAEIYREGQHYDLLSIHYNAIGNKELRDKYIAIAIERKPSDDTIIFLRGLQSRPDLIPKEVIKREYKRKTGQKNWLQRARMLSNLGRHREAAADYLRGIKASLNKNEIFSAAYYLKELSQSHLIEELFVLALKQEQADGDLWWQVRSLQELGWYSELNALLKQNENYIRESGDLHLLELLALSNGDHSAWLEIQKEIAMHDVSSGEDGEITQ